MFDDVEQLLSKAHLKETVGLVKDNVLNRGKLKVHLNKYMQESARGCYDTVTCGFIILSQCNHNQSNWINMLGSTHISGFSCMDANWASSLSPPRTSVARRPVNRPSWQKKRV